MNHENANEILPGLWLGDEISSKDEIFLRNKKISVVFNCTTTKPFSSGLKKRYRIAVQDNLKKDQIYKMYYSLDSSATLIFKHLSHGHVVLVHCHAGRQRSVAIIVAFLMKYGQMSKNDAIRYVRSKRYVACKPVINFNEALETYSEDLRGHQSSMPSSLPK